MKQLTRNLIDNSIEAFILVLETTNRPSVKYRMEAFCFLFCNVWELLIKAELHNDGKKIFHRKKKKRPRRSFSLDDCINLIFTSQSDPVKINIKTIHEFRNNAIHLVILFLTNDIMGLSKAGVLNHPKALQKWFGIGLSNRIPSGMMVLVYDFDPKQQSLDYAKMTRKVSAETVSWLTEFQEKMCENKPLLLTKVYSSFIPPSTSSLPLSRSLIRLILS